ncbi:MAG: hypothetical protein CMH64_03640 [Nanoarchaeota archaeon]|nr:hypothetical protein [Nanoarchaeota archaeon]|tara:strand:+ start:504 stop:785 length:282 start_codon:yes stop_codon:yes gene_type:complete
MELDRIKALDLKKNEIVEARVDDAELSKRIDTFYFDGIVESLPEQYREGHREPPYVVLVGHKDKNGCFRDFQEYKPEEIHHIKRIGPSSFAYF